MDTSHKQPGTGEEAVSNKFLGISLLQSQTASAASVVDVAAVMEKPGVKTPSRAIALDVEVNDVAALGRVDTASSADSENQDGFEQRRSTRVLPEVPKHRHGVPLRTALHLAPKKTPPKAPPPRRRAKLKASEAPIEQANSAASE
jgi:hypothetical protein